MESSFQRGNVSQSQDAVVQVSHEQHQYSMGPTKDGNMYFVHQKASNQLKLTLKVASVFKKQV